MKKRVFVLLAILFLFSIAKAQLGKEAWHWQFGDGAALDFSSGTPVVGTSAIYTREGCASISDANTGNLLFYTDGTYVYNKNNAQMPNGYGLYGNTSTTQSALIVPKPGSSTIYYIITCDDQGGSNGVCYSIVDMSLNGGLGDVSGTKNTLLSAPPMTEKLVGVKQCNGTDYWIIDHNLNSNTFNAYQVTAAGINATPVTSSVGTVVNNSGAGNEAIGYLKASPNGKKLALGVEYAYDILELYDFDASTGIVTNPITMPLGQGGYGVSFSPDNTKLYTTYADGYGNLFQFDISSGIAATIIASKTIIASGNYFDAMQIGPDGKIYLDVYGTSLSVINNPNAAGAACNYQASAINLSPGSCLLGLPNFIDANGSGTTVAASNAVQCNTFTTDTLNAGSGFSSYQWSTGATTQTITINTPGKYWVTAVNSTGCTVTDTIKAYTINPSNIHVLRDTTICSSTGLYSANATYSGAQSYLWYDGTTNPIKSINASGTYSVSIFFPGGCVVHNTFNLTLNTKPTVNLGNDTIICNTITSPIILNAGAGGGYTYHWSTGASTQTISVSSGGTYWATVSSAVGCSATDTIHIVVVGSGTYHVFDTSLCSTSDFPVFLNPPPVPGSNNYYYWSNGNSGHTDYAYYSGSVILDIYVNGGSCIITDIFNIVLDTARPHINNMAYCNTFTPYVVSAGSFAHYQWSTGATTSSITINSTGTYWVKVTSSGGCASADTFSVSVINPAKVHPIRDTVICQPYYYYDYMENAYVPGAQSYSWYDGYTTTPIHYFYTTGLYWVDIHFAGGCVVRDSFFLVLNQAPEINLGNDQAICGPLSSPIILNGGYFPSYQWSTGANTESISVTTSGIYWETVTATNGCKATDSIDIQIYPYGNTYHDTTITVCSANPFPMILTADVPNSYYNYYDWSNGYSGYTDYIYSAQTYYVKVNIGGYNSNCIVIDTFHVNTGTIVKPAIPDFIVCNSSTPDILDAGSGYTSYHWSTGATTESITVNSSGNYIVTVTNSQGCKTADTVKVAYNSSPQINILKDTSLCSGQSSITCDATYPGATSYLWSDGFTYPIHTLSIAGNYWVTYTLSTTCTAKDSFTIALKTVKYLDVLPNIVTPNNDGKNDFIDFGVYQFPAMQLYIYNRWGTKIYDSNNPNCVWQPTCDDGTYFYVITYTADCDVSGTTKTLKGFITVVR
jgi:gliding motility-associated-like protein